MEVRKDRREAVMRTIFLILFTNRVVNALKQVYKHGKRNKI